MNGEIIPTILSFKQSIYAVLNVQGNNKFIIISDAIYFAEIHCEKVITKKYDNVNFPLHCKKYYSNLKNVLYGFGTRDFYAIDLDSKQMKALTVSHDPNESILSITLINTKSNLFLIKIDHTGFSDEQSYQYFLTYDFYKNNCFGKSDNYQYGGMINYLNDTEMIFQQWNDLEPTKWYITNNELSKFNENELTKKLSKLNIYTWESNGDYKNRKMIGLIDNDSGNTIVSITWDEKFKDVSIVPLTFHEPKNRLLGEKYQFSHDGKWVRCNSEASYPEKNSQIVFINSDKKYPANLSIPVSGMIKPGDIYAASTGIFLDTPEYGTVYLDISDGLDGIIYMYKMSDVLNQIVKKSAEMVK